MEGFQISHLHLLVPSLIYCCLYLLNLSFSYSLNMEGVALMRFRERVRNDPHGALSNWIDEVGVERPCSWFGVECSSPGYVVSLNLEDMCLSGALAPDIGNLVHLKSIILRNNSFSGVIPEEIVSLKQLQVLDLGYNNLSGQIPCQHGDKFSMVILLLDNNKLLTSCPEIDQLQKLSQVQVEKKLSSSITRDLDETGGRRLSQDFFSFPFYPPPSQDSTPSPSPTSTPASPPQQLGSVPSPSPSSLQAPVGGPEPSRKNHHRLLIVSATTGGSVLLLLIIGIYFWQSGKVSTVKPWVTGLSGQLQRAFVTGVPKLKRSELEAACEDFSNVIGSASLCTLYKGTLSSGVEIAVSSIAMSSAKDWSNNMEAQFRKKIDTLSKVNHKNFVSLIGYCVEEEPFTKMMVFEYAPNGTLFEHIHIKEAEHLDWSMRMRIAMGIAYCLDHMHQLTPPIVHTNLKSTCVYLTEDYAAKVSDFGFSDEGSSSQQNVKTNVYSFGVILYEMITGKLPGSDSNEDWALDYLKGLKSLKQMVDPTLETYREDEVEQVGGVIRMCTNPEPRERPSMNEVCVRLREITGIESSGAIPKLSPLWWAELEIQSSEGS